MKRIFLIFALTLTSLSLQAKAMYLCIYIQKTNIPLIPEVTRIKEVSEQEKNNILKKDPQAYCKLLLLNDEIEVEHDDIDEDNLDE